MRSQDDISDIINAKIRKIFNDVIDGKISLLDTELVPIFNELKDSVTTLNLNTYSKTYIEACKLLDKKFEELKDLINSLDEEGLIREFLMREPSDREFLEIFHDCWQKTFDLDTLSYKFLRESGERLLQGEKHSYKIEHLEKEKVKDEFILELPKEKFTEKMMNFFNEVNEILPCKFDEVFDNLEDQIQIYEKFVYLLHLLQSGKIKYQSETNTLYK